MVGDAGPELLVGGLLRLLSGLLSLGLGRYGRCLSGLLGLGPLPLRFLELVLEWRRLGLLLLALGLELGRLLLSDAMRLLLLVGDLLSTP